MATVVGMAVDLQLVEMLFTSLLVQATRALTEAGNVRTTQAGYRSGRMNRAPAFRRAFLLSYAHRIGERLEAAGEQATAESSASHGAELVPVLQRRAEEVDQTFARLFPQTGRFAPNGSTRAAGTPDEPRPTGRSSSRARWKARDQGSSRPDEDLHRGSRRARTPGASPTPAVQVGVDLRDAEPSPFLRHHPPAARTAAASSSLVIFDRPGMSSRCADLYSSARVGSVTAELPGPGAADAAAPADEPGEASGSTFLTAA